MNSRTSSVKRPHADPDVRPPKATSGSPRVLCVRSISILLSVCLAVAGGCGGDEDVAPSAPAGALGRIAGRVIAGGVPLNGAEVTAWRMGNDPAGNGSVTDRTDSTGRYEADVAPGSYRISVEAYQSGIYYSQRLYWRSEGPPAGYARAESVKVAPGADPVRADFEAAALDLQVRLSTNLAGRSLTCTLTPASGGDNVRITANAEGDAWATFRFPLLEPGDYRAKMGDVWLPGSYDRESGQVFTAETGHTASATLAMAESSILTGSVRGSWQQMDLEVPPSVVPFLEDSTALSGTGVGSDDGAFALLFYAPVRVRLAVKLGWLGEEATTWIGGDSYGGATVFDLHPGDRLSDVHLVESGIIARLDGPGEESARFPTAVVVDEAGKVVRQTTGGQGTVVRMAGFRPGTYRLQVAPERSGDEDWLPQWYDRAESLAAATPITIASEGELVDLTVHLIPAGRIAGEVERPDGTPMEGADVYVTVGDTNIRRIPIGQTERGGVFLLRGLRDGNYRVGTKGESGWIYWHPGTAKWDSATVVRIENHAWISDLRWRVGP